MFFQQDCSESHLEPNLAKVGSILAPTIDPKCCPKKSQHEATKKEEKRSKKTWVQDGLRDAKPDCRETGSISYKAAGGGRGDQEPPTTASGPPLDAPRSPQDRPRMPQDHSETASRHPKTTSPNNIAKRQKRSKTQYGKK